MNIDKLIIDSIHKTNIEIIETATNVNQLSYVRKQITSETIMLVSELVDKNSIIITNYRQVFKSLQDYISKIKTDINTFKNNLDLFRNIISEVDFIKGRLENITTNITELFKTIDSIKKDTDEINTLATNATIVSAKYNTAVFQILSAKFNTMSEYVSQNLNNIIKFVSPIKDSIDNLIKINSLVLTDVESGYHNYILFLQKIEHQEKIVEKQIQRAEFSGSKIEGQKDMLNSINIQVSQMDSDASKAIDGSGNVIKIGESLKEAVDMLLSAKNNGIAVEQYVKAAEFITKHGGIIRETATNVNAKSKSQLDFSYKSLEFCKSIINQSKELKETVDIFNKKSIENNRIATKISTSIRDLIIQLNDIEERILISDHTLKKFTDDYLKINDIIVILKDILRLIKIIGIYSRIEASREPVKFEGFMTISKNIQKLQNRIKNTLPRIESNIKNTKIVIEDVNNSYQNISSVFQEIMGNSKAFTNELNEISHLSTDAEKISISILDESLNLDTLLSDLDNYLNKLTEVVKMPIEGSGKNIQRGKFLEEKSREISKMLLQ
jgi:methyl-accepting chemotaxis protein